ncbi:MAG: response regulator [Bdellovibrionales bacterium]
MSERKKKILIVDDEDIVRRALFWVLDRSVFEVFEAKDGVEALEMWGDVKPDLVFLDVLMLSKTGVQVLEERPSEKPK